MVHAKPRLQVHVPTDGTVVCLPGETVLTVPTGVAVTIGSGLRAKPASTTTATGDDSSSSAPVGSKRPRESALDETPTAAAGTGAGAGDESTSMTVVAAVMGPLMTDKTSHGVTRYYIPTPTAKRYLPRFGDAVVGAIVRVTTHSYSVNIGAAHLAYLSTIAFDGASKNNRPKLRPGDVVYCHVATCDPDLDVCLSCCATSGMVAKDWVTGEAVFGPLAGGSIMSLPLQTCKELYSNASSVLAELGERIPYEISVGLNGKVWVKAGGSCDEVVMSNIIALKTCLQEAVEGDEASLQQTIESLFPAPGQPMGNAAAAGVPDDEFCEGDNAFMQAE